MIKFNIPAYTADEDKYLREVIQKRSFCGEGVMTKRCEAIMQERFAAPKVLLTTSCSAALDMAALLCSIKEGDEVILPSYTFSTTASSFALRKAKLVFVDIRPDTMNIDETKIEAAITPQTKVISVVHYAGVSCEMKTIMELAKKYHLFVVEDAAQGVMSAYNGKALGTIGDFGCFSFHDTKNYNMGEGGALLVKHRSFFDQADNILDCGNNKKAFKAGKVSEYSWVDLGSSFLPSEFNAAFLLGQLDNLDKINNDRLATWNHYYQALEPLCKRGLIELPFIPKECIHNAHMFYIKTRNNKVRTELMQFLKLHGIQTASHYVPLHSSAAGSKNGVFHGEDRYTTVESRRLLRLPMYYQLAYEDTEQVIDQLYAFYQVSR
ncbi:MAG: dTDP-4-amino-4,6-dideoxygalactose transaminase [Erysipelotrichaceae bacterium]|nr:dTDP-4-amino-4,6-dideoxygalactose transaminase [Erysipelotrichaceae bacterium]